MRDVTHSELLAVRIHPALKAQLVELARARKMSAAEAAREAVRSYLVAA
jgi:predicted transcriptional regulator